MTALRKKLVSITDILNAIQEKFKTYSTKGILIDHHGQSNQPLDKLTVKECLCLIFDQSSYHYQYKSAKEIISDH